MSQLLRGQKIKLADVTPALQLRARLTALGAGLTFDFSCFGVDASGKLSDDRYLIFYNQKSSPENALRLEDEGVFAIDLARLPRSIGKLIFVATIDGPGTMAGLQRGTFSLLAGTNAVAQFAFQGSDFGSERSIMVAEIYLKDVWRLAAVGQGFAGGLDAVLKHFGGQQIEAAPVVAPIAAPRSRPNLKLPVPASVSSAAPPPVVPRDPNGCARCGKSAGFFGQVLGGGLDRTTRRCKNCEEIVRGAFERLRSEFAVACHSGVLNTAEWNSLWTRFESMRTGATRSQCFEFLRPDALRFLERLLTMTSSNGVVTPQEENYLRQMGQFLEVPATMMAPFFERIKHINTIASIRQGHLPQVSPGDNHLDAGEICHLYTPATYQKVGARSTSLIVGRLMATNKKLVFLSPSGGTSIQWKNIMIARASPGALHLELVTRSGNGAYQVSDSQWCEAVVTTLTRMAKRQLLSPQSDNPTRHIPQDVKNAVYQRDGGRCVQCRADTYLEFDHILPFSRGGANTLGNVQLLCRKCNGEKGNRI